MRKKLRVGLLVAALIVLLLAAAGIRDGDEVGHHRLFQLLRQPVEPLKAARHMLASNLGSAENGRLAHDRPARAVYDGFYVRAVVEVAPAGQSGLMLVDPWGDPGRPSFQGPYRKGPQARARRRILWITPRSVRPRAWN